MIWDFDAYGYFTFLVSVVTMGWAFMHVRNRPVSRAVMLAVMVGWCFMPRRAYLDLPLFPPLQTPAMVALGAFLGLLIFQPARVRQAKLGSGLDKLWLLFVAGQIGGFLTNQDPVVFGPNVRPPLVWKDPVSGSIGAFISYTMPYILGRVIFRSRKDAVQAALVIAMVGIVYLPLIAYELKMAPVVHKKLYGYMAMADFRQSIREGGFRPGVFMGHGLVMGVMWVTTALTTAMLYRLKVRRVWLIPTGPLLVVMLITLIALKAKTALAIGILVIPLVLWASPRAMVRVSALIGVLALVYPVLHIAGEFPEESILEALEPFGEDRVASMEFRFHHEALLSERAMERPWFGWGGYGRERLYDDDGEGLSVQDGAWVIFLGVDGLLGFLTIYGMAIFPLLLAWRRLGRIKDKRDQVLVGAVSLVVAGMVANSVPNMWISLMTTLFAGALVALTQVLPAQERRDRQARVEERRARLAARRAAGERTSSEQPHSPPAAAQH